MRYSLLLIFSLLISIFLLPPALSETSITIQNLSIKAGETAQLPVTIKGAENITVISFILLYNPDIITIESVNQVASGQFESNISEEGILMFAISESSGINEGILATLNIKGKNAGITALEFETPTIFKDDGSDVIPLISGGIITVEGKAGAVAAATAEQVKPTEPVRPPATTSPKPDNSGLATPANITTENGQNEQKNVKTPALSWGIALAIIILTAIVLRRRIS